VIPTVKITDPANYKKFGFGTWHYGPGVPVQKRLDLMPEDYDYAAVNNGPVLLRFFTITGTSDLFCTDRRA
jgi:hypothetical protein